ncbi:hypothetical protein [Pedobacter mucosus]|uniref:hypothetical protein n=1 Tax=Pedobacter mucosus TaxID=2895286 RepID=UPI001EE4A7E2|nr:hypothetical protein [Pedobacter mucosus]UKT64639.1 hypothetical protein LOK61_02395 [Pedobacter mucosus]
MKKIITSAPCTQNWDEMEQKDGNKFCFSCCKSVIDFTGLTDAEVIKTIVNSPAEVCGRITQSQINQLNYYLVVTPANRNWMKYLGVLAIGVSIFAQDLHAEIYKQPTEIVKPIVAEKKVKDEIKITLKYFGYIFIGSGKPAVGMKIRLKNTPITAITDENGRYEIKIDDRYDRKYNTLITEDTAYSTTFQFDFNSTKQKDYYPSKTEHIYLGGISISGQSIPLKKKN